MVANAVNRGVANIRFAGTDGGAYGTSISLSDLYNNSEWLTMRVA